MEKYQCENRTYLQSELFSRSGAVIHGFTCRSGGVSSGRISGLNLGFRVNDNYSSVMENYRLVAQDLNFDLSRTVLTKQTHTDNIRIVSEEDAGKGIIRESDIEDTDGLITDIKNMTLVVFTADCVPILLLDPVKAVIAAVHSGWKGTVKKIGGRAAEMMKEIYGCKPENILAAIGPSIGPCCFEFGRRDAEQFPDKYRRPKGEEKVLVDLWRMNRDILAESGIPQHNIDTAEVCTVCHSDEFYSYRTYGENTGRQGAVIMLRE